MKKVISVALAVVLLLSVLVIPAGATVDDTCAPNLCYALQYFCNYTVTNSTGITVRTGPGTGYDSVGAVAKGSSIAYSSEERITAGGYTWVKIVSGSTFTSGTWGKTVGYWMALIDNSAPTSKTYTIKSSSGANVRKSAGTAYSVTGALAKGSVVYYDQTKTANGSTWYHITKVSTKSGSWGSFVGYWVANV